jgi:hypothetical protein
MRVLAIFSRYGTGSLDFHNDAQGRYRSFSQGDICGSNFIGTEAIGGDRVIAPSNSKL